MGKDLMKCFGDDNLVEVFRVTKVKWRLLLRVIIEGEKSAQ